MHQLIIERNAEADLEEMWNSGDADAVASVALIDVALEEIGYDSKFLERMYRRNESRSSLPSASADQILSLWKQGKNIHRLKIWFLPDEGGHLCPYRVVYAHDARSDAYHVLGVVHRDVNYDEYHPKFQRILRDYEGLGIPTY